MLHCNNCGAEFKGNYCSNCGQKAGIGRLHLHDIWHEVWHAFTHADKGILKLIKDLILHPASVYHHYFEGRRKYYFSPVLFYVLTAGLSIYLGDHIFEYENKVNRMNNEFGKLVLDYTKLFGLLLLPLEALLTWAVFHKRYNLAECAVFWLFCNGLVFVFKIIISPIYIPLIWHKDLLDYWVFVATCCIFFWQLAALFAWQRGWAAYLSCFVLVNVLIVLSHTAIYFLLFDTGATPITLWQLIKDAYQL